MSGTDKKDATPRPQEQKKALLVHHMKLLRAKAAEVEEARAPLKARQEEFTALINDAKSDLGKGYTRKHLMSLLDDVTSRLRDLLREEQQRAHDREALGLPVFGLQADLFENEQTARMPAEARDEVHYEAEGFMRGRNGALEAIPEGTPTRFHQAVLRGFQKGQELTQADILAAAQAKAREQNPDANAEVKDLSEPEPGTVEHEAALEESTERARRSLEAMGSGDDAADEPEVDVPAHVAADAGVVEAAAVH